jgi:hypothetical protein
MQPSRPRVSGKWSAAFIGVCLLVSAVLLPTAAHLPTWVEFELVRGIWWIVWFVLLSWMLYQGHEVEDDADAPDPRLLRKIPWGEAAWEGFNSIGCLGSIDGCLWPVLIIAGLAVLAVAAIFVYELLLPGIAFLIYLAIRGMVARVINDRHHCAGESGLSQLWGIIWATAYTAPIAAIVYAIHWWVQHKGV